MELSDINLLDLDKFAEGPPLDWFKYLREHKPIYRHPDHTERGFWALTKFDDIAKAAKTPTIFSSSYERGGTVVLGHNGIDTMRNAAPRVMNNMDAPEHLKYRRLSTRAFTNKALDGLIPAYRQAAIDLIDKAVAAESVDFVTDIAALLPVQAISEMLGVPEEDRHLMAEWVDAMLGSEDPELSRSPEEVTEANVAMFDYGHRLREKRLREPGDDLMSTLVAARIDGEGLTDDELAGFFALLVIAGAETSRNVLTHGLIGLLENPEQYSMLHADPALAKDATEEILRWAPAVIYLGRHLTQDVEFGGQQMKEGDRVALFFASGNRDEDKFEDADRFDIHRRPREHLAFGSGPHVCLGAHLARIEIRVFYEELARRAAMVQITDKPAYLRSNLAGGVKHLPIQLTRA